MDHRSDDYEFGRMAEKMYSLEKSINALNLSVLALSNDLNEIKLFRARVLGMAVASSAITSGIVVAVSLAVQTWAK